MHVFESEITKHADNISRHSALDRCCIHSADNKQIAYSKMAGQQFAHAIGGNSNVVIGYGNYNHLSKQKPSDVGGWGVNGPGCQSLNWYIG